MSETEEMLENVNKAINSILLVGQSYNIGDKKFTKADLSELRALKKDLKRQLLKEKRGYTGFNVADFSNINKHNSDCE